MPEFAAAGVIKRLDKSVVLAGSPGGEERRHEEIVSTIVLLARDSDGRIPPASV